MFVLVGIQYCAPEHDFCTLSIAATQTISCNSRYFYVRRYTVFHILIGSSLIVGALSLWGSIIVSASHSHQRELEQVKPLLNVAHFLFDIF